MTDCMSPEQRSSLMSRIRGKNTGPELAVRRLAHALGFRFRLHRRDLPGTPDLVFPRLRKVIMVHGCFWHHHPDPGCRNAVLPKTRPDWWRAKLSANAARDVRNMQRLSVEGWDVLVLWECEVRSGAFGSELTTLRNFLIWPELHDMRRCQPQRSATSRAARPRNCRPASPPCPV